MTAPEPFSPAAVKQLTARVPEVQRALLNNLDAFPQYPETPLLKAGDQYEGIWLEHNQDNFFLADYAPESAWGSQEAFMRLQREDGLFPFALPLNYRKEGNFFYGYDRCFWHVQTVWPFARCAMEIARKTGRPEEDFARIYRSAAAYDRWFVHHRCEAKTGLPAMYCEYDTGHDNSPRWKSVPKLCPREEARNCPDGVMPRFAPDLSATLYGMRIALAEMADALGRKEEQAEYCAAAERTRRNIGKYCFDPEREFYFDRIPGSGFCGIVGDAGLRVLGEHVPSQVVADRIFRRYILNPEAFWTPYPLPSIAANDPEFMYPPCLNCWGGASQALAALRTLRYFEFYGYGKELRILMTRWLEAILRTSGFQQQMDPFTGEFSTSPGYSPCMCVALEFGARLSEPEGLSMGAFVHDVAELLG